ncbi:MAG: hypothetical protein QXG00_01670 [Candidatus Woesearchaeota archaeon]
MKCVFISINLIVVVTIRKAITATIDNIMVFFNLSSHINLKNIAIQIIKIMLPVRTDILKKLPKNNVSVREISIIK